jgi:hypothetical protein
MHDWFYQYYCGAGRGARVKYREVSGRWQKRIFRRPLLIPVALAMPIVIVGLLERPHFGLWPLCMFFSCLIGAYIAFIESPPGHIEHWRTGYEGERRTARALAPLRKCGYVLLHDLPDRRTVDRRLKGNIDHVVVSTGGVFLLDSKWLGGGVSVARGTVHVQRHDDDDDSYELSRLASAMRGRAVRLQQDIVQGTGVSFVQPVVVFWNDFEAKLVTSEKVVFVHGNRLVSWLQEQRPVLGVDRVVGVGSHIEDVRPPENRAWWARLPAFGHRGGSRAAVSPTPGSIVS